MNEMNGASLTTNVYTYFAYNARPIVASHPDMIGTRWLHVRPRLSIAR